MLVDLFAVCLGEGVLKREREDRNVLKILEQKETGKMALKHVRKREKRRVKLFVDCSREEREHQRHRRNKHEMEKRRKEE